MRTKAGPLDPHPRPGRRAGDDIGANGDRDVALRRLANAYALAADTGDGPLFTGQFTYEMTVRYPGPVPAGAMLKVSLVGHPPAREQDELWLKVGDAA